MLGSDVILVERCEPVPVPERATSNTTHAIVETVATIECHLGYTFADLSDVITTQCDRNAKNWTVTPGECLRKFMISS